MVQRYDSNARYPIRIRGTRDGLVLHFPEEPAPLDLIQDLQDEIDRAGNFFQRGEIIIDYGSRPPDQDEIGALLVLLRERGVRLRSVTASTTAYQTLLAEWGFDQPRTRSHDSTEIAQIHHEERQAYHIQQPLHSGERVHQNCDVVVHGDVEPGAEIETRGNVIVWGALRGSVHAGLLGDHSAYICALSLSPERLRVGRYAVYGTGDPLDIPDRPVMVKVVDDQLVAVEWKSARGS
jgi:septum site-determining protein MinC